MQPADFFAMSAQGRHQALMDAIERQHRYHFAHNAAYRRTLGARGVGEHLRPDQLRLLLRPAALTFKSYIDQIGPFPEDHPVAFLEWLGEQLSIPLPRDRWPSFRRRYRTLDQLLSDTERIYADLGIEVVTSTGTSGRASIVVRNASTVRYAVQAFFDGIRRAWGVIRGTTLVLVMPEQSRVAMARIAQFGTRTLDWTADSRVCYTMPFSATSDRLRIRAGRTFRPGMTGVVERRVLHPFMAWANQRMAVPRYVALTQECLHQCAQEPRPIMLLGGLQQLHAIARRAPVGLPPGSRVATGGGMKDDYAFTPAQIRADLRAAFKGVPVADVYGMAEANWAAFECEAGHYHVPPWVHVVVTDDDDRIMTGPDVTGLLAFFDPIGGGEVIPPFFQAADRVRLVNGGGGFDPGLRCRCGDDSAYIAGGIERVDLIEEAGCAAQV